MRRRRLTTRFAHLRRRGWSRCSGQAPAMKCVCERKQSQSVGAAACAPRLRSPARRRAQSPSRLSARPRASVQRVAAYRRRQKSRQQRGAHGTAALAAAASTATGECGATARWRSGCAYVVPRFTIFRCQTARERPRCGWCFRLAVRHLCSTSPAARARAVNAAALCLLCRRRPALLFGPAPHLAAAACADLCAGVRQAPAVLQL